jgi:nicotine blue oxidoreductase
MGGPKALLVVDGKPLILRHVDRLVEAGCGPIVVVVRSAVVDAVRAVLPDRRDVRIALADTSSPAASLAVALRSQASLPENAASVVVTPVDMVPVQRSTLDALLEAVTSEGALVATPCHRGQSGHPVVVRESLLRVFRGNYGGTLRDVIRAADRHRRRVHVNDAAVLGDLDTPLDLRSLRVPERVSEGRVSYR